MREYIVLTHPQANQKVVVCIDDITDIEPYRRFNGTAWEWQSLVHIRNTSRAIRSVRASGQDRTDTRQGGDQEVIWPCNYCYFEFDNRVSRDLHEQVNHDPGEEKWE